MDALATTYRDEAANVVASLIRQGASFDQAEDAVREAFAVAAVVWARDGVPAVPGGWIATTAKRKLLDRLRRERRRGDKERSTSDGSSWGADPAAAQDDRLWLIFTCCHPALGLDTRVALTLHSVCRLTTAQLASAFLVSEPAMAQRLVRAKRKIASAGIPFVVPDADDLAARLDAVLATVYLAFTTGYDAVAGGDADAADLCAEAIRLARLLRSEMPNDADIVGLLALLLLGDARRDARVDDHGEIVLFDDQDRDRWHHDQITEGLRLVEAAPAIGPVGHYWLQAAIAAEHVAAARPDARDWRRICGLYRWLSDRTGGSAVVELNRAIAESMLYGPDVALARLEPLGARLANYQYFHAAAADFHARSGDDERARCSYRRAIDLTTEPAARRSLQRALERLDGRPGAGRSDDLVGDVQGSAHRDGRSS